MEHSTYIGQKGDKIPVNGLCIIGEKGKWMYANSKPQRGGTIASTPSVSEKKEAAPVTSAPEITIATTGADCKQWPGEGLPAK